ncbi:MAG TPA: asparagine synthase-related protein, partial [Aequorivita sp.]|nr:asparagine synthase-related protein [Aequorivita sp.]
FYLETGGNIIVRSNISEILKEKESENYLDFTSIVQLLNKNFIFGDRTLIQGVKRTPWMGKLNEEKTGWDYFNVPAHSERQLNQNGIAEHLFALLEQEMLEYVSKFSQIGILLTGGMDSRIVACVLNQLIIKGKLSNKQVMGITWGLSNSRDVVYASRIAKLLNWEWIHLSVDAEQIMENSKYTVDAGCEFSPIHLHAMSKVADLKGVECILAGSFGDSIGRGEYSGKHVQNLKPLNTDFKNVGGILRTDFLELSEAETKNEIQKYHELFPQQKKYQQLEQDYQLHYMRRMLNPCFAVISKRLPVFQMFTSSLVFGFMWSLNPLLRNNMIYKKILENNNKQLLEIPWARYGMKYPETEGKGDEFLKRHHNYGTLIRREVLTGLKDKIKAGPLQDANIFNMKSIYNLIRFCKKTPLKESFFYEEKLIWIGAFSDFMKEFNIKSDLPKEKKSLKAKLVNYGEYYGRYLTTKLR